MSAGRPCQAEFTSTVTRIFVADDGASAEFLREIVDAEADMLVVGVARDGRHMAEGVRTLRPDLVLLDAEAPQQEPSLFSRLLAQLGTPFAMLGSAPCVGFEVRPSHALVSHAVDVLEKPTPESLPGKKEAFLLRLRRAASAVAVRKRCALESDRGGGPVTFVPEAESHPNQASLVVIAAAMGGHPCVCEALQELIPEMAPPIVVIQHMASAFMSGFAAWLNARIPLRVRLATDGAELEPGAVFLVPGTARLRVEGSRLVSLHEQAPELSATDSLFASAAAVHGARAIGVLLSGAGNDGAVGLDALFRAGGTTLTQRAESCLVPGMPGAAAARGVSKFSGTPAQIGRLLRRVRWQNS